MSERGLTAPASGAAPAAGVADGGVEYQQLYRAGRQPVQTWSALGVFVVAVFFLGINAIVAVVGATLAYLATGTPQDQVGDKVAALADTDLTTPASLLFVHVVLIMVIPEVWAVTRLVNGLRPRWLTSVRPGIRWGWFAASFGVSIATFVITIFLGGLLPSNGDADLVTGGLNDFTSTTRDFLLVIVLLTPFQAIAEEYVFRGYLTQVAGGILADERVAKALAVLVPATLFALAHGSQDVPLFFDRFAFGVMAGVLVILTGGLEAPIAMHVLNNWFAFGLALAFGQLDEALTASTSTWWAVPVTVVRTAVFLVGAVLVHRWMHQRDRADSAVLIASRGRVYGLASAP